LAQSGIDDTPNPVFASSVRNNFHTDRPQRPEIRTHTAEIARYSATFATLLLPAGFRFLWMGLAAGNENYWFLRHGGILPSAVQVTQAFG